jgi:two-component system, LytTR family, response regulator
MTINCMILDDEPQNVKLLSRMLAEYCPNLQVLAAETDAGKGLTLIEQLHPQLLFLDVEMPRLNGFDVLKQLEPIDFEVIFVTAYNKYAVEAFEVHATGFLTKPVSAEKLMAAVDTASRRITEKAVNKNIFSLLAQTTTEKQVEKIPLSTSTGLLFVKITDIMYCESSGNYTHFFMHDDQKVVVSRQLGEYEKLLPEKNFIRIHDKYIINLAYIKSYIKGSGGDVVLENGKELPVASRRKDDFLLRFDKWLKRK